MGPLKAAIGYGLNGYLMYKKKKETYKPRPRLILAKKSKEDKT